MDLVLLIGQSNAKGCGNPEVERDCLRTCMGILGELYRTGYDSYGEDASAV